MAGIYNKVVKEDIFNLLVKVNQINIKRAEFGFAQSDCAFVDTMLATMCLHAIDNPDIFTHNNDINIRYILNIFTNERT